MQGRGGQEGVDAWIFGALHGFPAAVDIAVHATGEPGHLNVSGLRGDGAHGFEIAGTGGGKARFHDVHAQHFQLMGKAQFFLEIHGGAGRLLAVAQGGVEEINAVLHVRTPLG